MKGRKERREQPSKARAQPSKAAAQPSFGTLGALGTLGLENPVNMSHALGNQAMGALLSGMVKPAPAPAGALSPGAEGPHSGPKVDIPGSKAAKPKDLSLEDRFKGFIAPFLNQLLWRIKDDKRRALVIDNIFENFKSGAQGWLEKGLEKVGPETQGLDPEAELADEEMEEIKRRYEERAYEEWWVPP